MADPTTPIRAGCTACGKNGGVENETPRSYNYGSTKSRILGRRSLDAFRSVTGTIKGRRTLETTTNREIASKPVGFSLESSPTTPPAKQRWYDSLRSKASQLPTPSSPTSMPPTLKRPGLFRSSDHSTPTVDATSPPTASHKPLFHASLPKLDLSSFQAELQTTKVFCQDPTTSTHYSKLQAEDQPAKKSCETASIMAEKTELAGPVLASNPEKNDQPWEEWRTQCALYYKGSPWQPEQRQHFPDATTALTHFCLHHMNSKHRRYSNVLLWIGEIPYTHPKTKQSFIIYPHYDGPRRLEIEGKYCLEWAFIVFRDDTKPSRLPPMKSSELLEEDDRLMAAVTKVSDMGYHIDMWTCRDNETWDFELEQAREFGQDRFMAKRLKDGEHIDRRQRYESFIRHGVAGFSTDDIATLDKIKIASDRPESIDESDSDYDLCDYEDSDYESKSERELHQDPNLEGKPEQEPEQEAEDKTEQEPEQAPEKEPEQVPEEEPEQAPEKESEQEPGQNSFQNSGRNGMLNYRREITAEESMMQSDFSIHSEDVDMAERLGMISSR